MHCPVCAASHCTHCPLAAPLVSHTGVKPVQSVAAQARQVSSVVALLVVWQKGVPPEQVVLSTHATQ